MCLTALVVDHHRPVEEDEPGVRRRRRMRIRRTLTTRTLRLHPVAQVTHPPQSEAAGRRPVPLPSQVRQVCQVLQVLQVVRESSTADVPPRQIVLQPGQDVLLDHLGALAAGDRHRTCGDVGGRHRRRWSGIAAVRRAHHGEPGTRIPGAVAVEPDGVAGGSGGAVCFEKTAEEVLGERPGVNLLPVPQVEDVVADVAHPSGVAGDLGEVGQQFPAVVRLHRFGVELHPPQQCPGHADTHDRAVGGGRVDVDGRREVIDGQGVVADHLER